MKYKVYEMIRPEILERSEYINYEMRTTNPNVLVEVEELPYIYESENDAYLDIVENKDKLKDKDLTIIPLLRIDWNGEMD